MDKIISYAQNREDLILAGFFEADEVGFYIDIGANSPEIDSVTKMFYEKGWKGINIEPIHAYYEQLKKARPRDKNLNIGISNKTGKLNLREYEGAGLSTFSESLKKQYEASPDYFTEDYKDYSVKVYTLSDIFAKYNVKHISFMKIDVEGYEHNVLESNDWTKYRPEIICIEANHIEQDWHNILKKNSYNKVFFDGLNEYFIDTTIKRSKKFSYVDAVINKEPIVHYRQLADLTRLELSHSKLLDLEKELELKTEQITHLEAILGEVMPLRRHFKRQLKMKLKNANKQLYNKLKSRNSYVPLSLEGSGQDAESVDKLNFSRYNQSKRAPFFLKIYLSLTGFGIRMASRILRITKV